MLRKTLWTAVLVGAVTSTTVNAAPLLTTVKPTQPMQAVQQQQVKVNINTASAAELAMSLTGWGNAGLKRVLPCANNWVVLPMPIS